LFRPGSENILDSGAGGVVPVGPNVPVGVERGLGTGMAQARLDGLDVRAELRRLI